VKGSTYTDRGFGCCKLNSDDEASPRYGLGTQSGRSRRAWKKRDQVRVAVPLTF
jgi:hypothetical protein